MSDFIELTESPSGGAFMINKSIIATVSKVPGDTPTAPRALILFTKEIQGKGFKIVTAQTYQEVVDLLK